MYILNGFASLIKFTADGVQSLVLPTQERETPNETTPLLDDVQQQQLEPAHVEEAQLTAGFKSYRETTRALYTCLQHAVIYYVLVVILFSFVVEHWSVIDSVYFATVVVSRRIGRFAMECLGRVVIDMNLSLFLIHCTVGH